MDKQELIQKLIDDITSDNNSEAGDVFNQLMNAKLSDSLDNKKQEVAQTVYSPSSTDTEELDTSESN